MCGGLNSCCCCFSLRSGSIIAGSFFLGLSAVNVASVILHNFEIEIPAIACFEDDILVTPEECGIIRKYATTAMLIAALMDCIHAFTCILLFFGIFRRSEVLMLPFMSMTVLQALRMVVLTALSIGVHYVLKLSMVILINSSVIHLAIVIYLGVVVYNYYPKIMKSMFKDWYTEMKKKRDQASVDPATNLPIAWIDFEKAGFTRSDSFLTLEIAKDEERAKACKDTLCIIVPILIVVACWGVKEFFLYMYL